MFTIKSKSNLNHIVVLIRKDQFDLNKDTRFISTNSTNIIP